MFSLLSLHLKSVDFCIVTNNTNVSSKKLNFDVNTYTKTICHFILSGCTRPEIVK